MALMSFSDDLFGHVPQRGELFREAQPIMPTIRAKMLAALAEVRAAETMPWNPRTLRARTAMFPYWAEWLKGGEGDQLLLDFKEEMDRLGAPVDQVAPNWREMWGLAA
jgi:hypothetical protein